MAGARICSTWGRVFCKGVARDIGVQTFYTVVLRVADERFTADAVIMDSMVKLKLEKEKGGGKEGRARARRVNGQRKEEAAQMWW